MEDLASVCFWELSVCSGVMETSDLTAWNCVALVPLVRAQNILSSESRHPCNWAIQPGLCAQIE